MMESFLRMDIDRLRRILDICTISMCSPEFRAELSKRIVDKIIEEEKK